MTFWSDAELAAMNVVEFRTTDAKGKPITFRTPACAKVKCGPRPLVWNVQQGLGLSGAVARFGGIGLAKGTITLKMGGANGAAYRQEFDLFCRKYLRGPQQGQPARVFDVRHPRLARLEIVRLHLVNDPAGDWDENTQIEEVVYEWEEDRKPLPTLSSATTAGNTKDGPKAKVDAAAGIKAAIAQNKATIDQLGKQLAAP